MAVCSGKPATVVLVEVFFLSTYPKFSVCELENNIKKRKRDFISQAASIN